MQQHSLIPFIVHLRLQAQFCRDRGGAQRDAEGQQAAPAIAQRAAMTLGTAHSALRSKPSTTKHGGQQVLSKGL